MRLCACVFLVFPCMFSVLYLVKSNETSQLVSLDTLHDKKKKKHLQLHKNWVHSGIPFLKKNKFLTKAVLK